MPSHPGIHLMIKAADTTKHDPSPTRSLQPIPNSADPALFATIFNSAFSGLQTTKASHQTSPLNIHEAARRDLAGTQHTELHEIAAHELRSSATDAHPSPAKPSTTANAATTTQPPTPANNQPSNANPTPRPTEPATSSKASPQPAASPSHDAAPTPTSPEAHIAAPAKFHKLAPPDRAPPAASAAAHKATNQSVSATQLTAISPSARALPGLDTTRQIAPQSPQQKSPAQAQPPIYRTSADQFALHASKALARVLATGGGSLSLRLNPEALGEVRVEIGLHRGKAHATFQASTTAARDLLLADIDALRAALERRGITVERLDVKDSPHTDAQPNPNDAQNQSPSREQWGTSHAHSRSPSSPEYPDQNSLDSSSSPLTHHHTLNASWHDEAGVLRLDAVA